MRSLLIATALIAVAGSPAVAANVLTDTFDTEGGGANILNYTGFANFSVVGQVDLVQSVNGFGIVAPSAVVDLDGTSGPGRVLTSATYAYGAASNVKLTFVLGGAQRGSIGDQFDVGFNLSPATALNNFTLSGGYGFNNLGNIASTPGPVTSSGVAGNSPFTSYSISFTTVSAGSLSFFIGSNSADNVGPLLDSVSLDITAVPEPETWALMIAGFGMVGFAARRRARVTA